MSVAGGDYDSTGSESPANACLGDGVRRSSDIIGFRVALFNLDGYFLPAIQGGETH